MIDMPVRVGMPLDEFLAEMELAPFELIDGKKKPLMSTVLGPGDFAILLYDIIRFFLRDQRILGKLLHEITFILPNPQDTQWVKGSRIPDLMFYADTRYSDYLSNTPDYYERPLPLVPDLVVEVISPTDNYNDVEKKVELYLQDGVRMVWVVNPQHKTIIVHLPDQTSTRLSGDAVLSGGDVLAGFELKLSELFATNS